VPVSSEGAGPMHVMFYKIWIYPRAIDNIKTCALVHIGDNHPSTKVLLQLLCCGFIWAVACTLGSGYLVGSEGQGHAP